MGQLHHLSMSHIGRQRINGVPGLLFHSNSCHPNPDLCPPLPLTKEGLKLRPVAQSMVTEMYISQCQAMAMTKGSIGTSWDELVAAANATELTAIKALGLAQAGHLHFLDRKHVDSLDLRPVPQAMLEAMWQECENNSQVLGDTVTTGWADLEGALSCSERAALDGFGISTSEKLYFLTQSQIDGLKLRPVANSILMWVCGVLLLY